MLFDFSKSLLIVALIFKAALIREPRPNKNHKTPDHYHQNYRKYQQNLKLALHRNTFYLQDLQQLNLIFLRDF